MKRHFNRILAAYVFVYSFFLASRPITDPDFWFHLKTGEYIIQRRMIPKADFFSFTNPGRAWVTHEWLSEAIFYVIYSRIGVYALVFVFALISALAFWIVFRDVEAHPFLKAFATLLSVWTIIPTVGVRPRVFTLLLTAVFLHLLTTYMDGRRSRTIWWLVPLTLLWVNLHAGFVIGLVLIALGILGLVFDAWAAGKSLDIVYSRLRMLALVLFACIAVVIINPHGPRIYLFPFEFFLSPVQQQLVTDWFSPDFHESGLLPLLVLMILTMAVLVISSKRPRPSEVMFFVATLYGTLKSSRHMAIFALVAGPLLAKYLHVWLVSMRFGRSFAKDPSFQSNTSMLVFCIALFLPLISFVLKPETIGYAPADQTVLNVPVSAVGYLKANQITGNTFTDPNIWGDYLIWALPSNPVYIDGRIDMYGDTFVKNYRDIIWGVADWKEPFNRYGVRVAILRRTSPLTEQLKSASEWRQVFADDMAVVFTR